MRQYFTIEFLLIFINCGLSQNTDSLKRMLYSKQKQEKVDLLLTLSKAYWYSNRDTALFYASEALQLSKDISYARGVAEAYRYIGVSNMFGARSHIAKPYLDTALKLFQNLHDTPGIAATYNNIGVLFQKDLGKFPESIVAFEQALKLFKQLGNLEGQGSALNYIGLGYQFQGNFQKAIEYLLQGLEVRKKIKDIQGAMFSLTRVGDLYQMLEQNEVALKYYMEALHLATENKAKPLSDTYAAIAKVYMESKHYEEAKKYIDLALKGNSDWYYLLLGRFYTETGVPEKALVVYKEVMTRSQKSSAYSEFASSILEISKIYQLKKDYPAAIKYARNAYEIASSHNLRWIISDAANSLSSLYAIQGNYRKAYTYEKIYRSISDSVSNVDSHLKLAFLESKNEIQQKQSSIELLNKDNQIKEQRLQREALLKKIFIGGIVVILIIAFVLLRNILLKRKAEKHQRELAESELQIQKLKSEQTETELKQQATELEMQALRAQMNPHFIFNSLNSINRFILQNNKAQASEYLTKFSRLVRIILNSSANASVSLAEDLEALQLYLELECLRCEQKFSFKIKADPDLDIDFIQVPPMLLQPFVENAIWHGLMNKESEGHLWINIDQQDSILICTITDDGIGRKKSAELKDKSGKHKSMGMKITESRIAMMQKMNEENKSIEIRDLVDADGNAAGTEVVLKIPIQEQQ